jgi:hypothetical protein
MHKQYAAFHANDAKKPGPFGTGFVFERREQHKLPPPEQHGYAL